MDRAIDHLVVAGGTLAAAQAHLETALGLAMLAGGAHSAMGTHNRLMSLGPGLYAEAIAIDPAAVAPDRPRWYGLDDLAAEADPAPRLAAWAVRVDDLDAALAEAPEGIGAPIAVSRGALSWRISLPETGRQPFDGVFPALIQWDGAPPALDDSGARLTRLTLIHPMPETLAAALAGVIDDARLAVAAGPPGLAARIETAQGERMLQ